MMHLASAANAKLVVRAPIAPGLIDLIGVDEWRRMPAGTPFEPRLKEGSIALDGEREIFFLRHDQVSIKLVENAFRTVDVAGVMQFAAHHRLFATSRDFRSTPYASGRAEAGSKRGIGYEDAFQHAVGGQPYLVKNVKQEALLITGQVR